VPLRRSVPLQRGLPPKRRVPVRKKWFQPRRGPERSPPGVSGLDSKPGMRSLLPSERRSDRYRSGHTNVFGSRGLGQKTSDFSAVPLCSGHHRENLDSYHALGEEEFSHRHGIDLKEIALRLQSRFWQGVSASPSAAASFRTPA